MKVYGYIVTYQSLGIKFSKSLISLGLLKLFLPGKEIQNSMKEMPINLGFSSLNNASVEDFVFSFA